MDNEITNLMDRQRAVIWAEDYWSGETYNDMIGGLTGAEAFLRPHPGLHTVAELISHVLEWRRDNIRKILGDRPHPIRMGAYEDWIPNDDLREKGWEALKREFYGSAEQLCELLRGKDDLFLRESPKGLEETYRFFLDGLINHDIYHLGQIGITLKLLRSKS